MVTRALFLLGMFCGACASTAGPSPRSQTATPAADAGTEARTCPAPNPVEAYLQNAELQAEDGQTANVRRAIRDLAELPAEPLAARRYADYQGAADQWDLADLLRHHFVPDHAVALPEGDSFWTCATADAVRSIARGILVRLDAPGGGSAE